MERPDLILSAADGYEWEDLRPFVESLRATGYDGEVHFVGRLSAETVSALAAAGVGVTRPRWLRFKVRGKTWHPYNPRTTRLRWRSQPLYRHVVRALSLLAPDRKRAQQRLTGLISNIEVARHFWYHDYLAPRQELYRNVMLTDVRDVLFLGDPFDFDIGETAHFFLEEEGRTLGSQVNNTGWIVGAYGQSGLDELRHRPISCAGVTIGSAPAIVGYLETMIAELMKLSRQFHGMDQGVHNYVVHHGLAPGAVTGNSEGPVLTVGIMEEAAAVALLSSRAEMVKVVHQYDRHPALVELLEARTGVPRVHV